MIAPRSEFWKGVQLIDFWTEEWDFQYASTIDRLQRLNYEWVMLSPPWDIKSIDPPIISNINVTVPAFPNAELREHIRVLKEGGFKVILRIQVCCSVANVTNKDVDWWNSWFDQYDAFVKLHADISREEDVDALILGSSLFAAELPLSPNNPAYSNSSLQWQRILTTARTSNAQIGFDTFAKDGLSADTNVLPWPGTDVDFFDDIDFLGVAIWGTVANSTNPTQNDNCHQKYFRKS